MAFVGASATTFVFCCLLGPIAASGGKDDLIGTIDSSEKGFRLDRSCWNKEFTVERCCLVSYEVALTIGCFEGEDADALHKSCCHAFLVWRPPPKTSPLRLTYNIAQRQIMDSMNGQHEGMVFGRIAAELGYSRCAEVGVLAGVWSEFFLVVSTAVDGRLSPSAIGEVQEYTLVDFWINQASEANYRDGTGTLSMSKMMLQAVQRLERFWPRLRFVQQQSHVGARLFDNASLDFVFIDARHDECAVRQDLEAWWPKVRPGGLLAGDDYLDADSAAFYYRANNDWSICENGEVRPGATRGAVDGFAAGLGLEVNIFRLPSASLSPQWLIFKPFPEA